MRDEALRVAYDELLRARTPSDRSACPAPEALLALVERQGTDAERMRTLDHVMGCAPCHRDVDVLRAATAAARETSGEERPLSLGRGGTAAGRPPFRLPRWAAIAAGLLIAVGLGVITRRPDRAETPGQGAVLRGAEPTIALLPAERAADGSTTLRWHGVAGAALYRVELFGPSGSTLTSAEVRDTVFVLRGDAAARGDSTLRWMVTALRTGGGELRSPSAPLIR